MLSSPHITTTTEMEFSPSGSEMASRVAAIDESVANHISPLYWDWFRLYAVDDHACPLQHPEVVLAEMKHLPGTGESTLVYTYRDGFCTGLAALLPKHVNVHRLGGTGLHCRLSGHRLAGNSILQQDSDPLITANVMNAVLQHIIDTQSQFLLIEDLDHQAVLGTVLSNSVARDWLQFRHAGVQTRHRIHFTPGVDYWQKFSSKTRQTFRRKLKKFGRTRLERITEVDQVASFLEAAHQISLRTWQTRQFGLRVRNNDYELAQLTTLAQLGLLRCYLWYVNEQPIAFTIGNQDNGCFHYEEVGYITESARYSPGQMMLVQMIEDLLEYDTPEWFDFGGGDADYKAMFANHESQSGTVWLFPPTLENMVLVGYLRLCRQLRSLARRTISNVGMVSRFRQWVRYGGKTAVASTGPELATDEA